MPFSNYMLRTRHFLKTLRSYGRACLLWPIGYMYCSPGLGGRRLVLHFELPARKPTRKWSYSTRKGNVMKGQQNAVSWLVLSVLLFCQAGCTDTGQWAIGAKGGTLGIGGELTKKVATDINTRAGFNMLDFSFDDDVAGIEYDFDMGLRSFSALVDWHIFDGPFRITGGVLSMDNEFDLDTLVNQNVRIGDNTYTPAQVDRLSGRVDIEGIAPYIGIGWGNPVGRGRRWGFYSDFGVAFAHSPDVTLRATGMMAGDPTFQGDLAKEERDIQDDMDALEFYPVLSAGLYIRF